MISYNLTSAKLPRMGAMMLVWYRDQLCRANLVATNQGSRWQVEFEGTWLTVGLFDVDHWSERTPPPPKAAA